MSNVYDDEFEVPELLLRDLADAPVVAEADIGRFGVTHYATAHADVSEAELDVLRYASRGLTKEQIAAARGVSLWTVKSQLKAVRYKLRAKNVTQACCEAIRRGLIP